MAPCFVILATTALVAPMSAAAPAEESTKDMRKGIRKFERAIGAAVGRVSRASGVPVAGAAEACRGYYLQGYGAFFVVAPRGLAAPAPSVRRASLPALREAVGRVQASLAEATDEEEKVRLAKALKDLQGQQRAAQAREELLLQQQQEQEMRAFEIHVRLMQQEAERCRKEAEEAMRQVADRLQMPVATSEDPPAGAPAGGPPTPPWHLWVDVAVPDERPPEKVLIEVRTAVARAIEEHGARLAFLEPDERVAVAVDFFPATPFANCGTPQRTLLVRAQKKVIDQLTAAAGDPVAADAARQQIEYLEY